MKPLQLLHLADTHIGVENYGRLVPATGLHTRLQDFVRCLEFAVDTALEREVDAVLFAGDAYKHATPSPTHEGKFAEQMKRLADARIPVVMVTGNHDMPASFGKASALNIFRTLGGEDVFYVAEKPCLMTIETKSGPFQVGCFPWPSRHVLVTKEEYRNLSADEITATISAKCENRITKFTRDRDPALPLVLLAHLAVAHAAYSGSEQTTIIGHDPVIAQGVLKNPAFEYAALGHIHKHQDLNPHGHPHIVYPGSLERIDFGEAQDEKGCCLVSLGKGGSEYEFVKTPARPFVKIDIDVRAQDFPTEAILKHISARNIKDAVVRISYTIEETQKGLIDLQRIAGALKEVFLVAGVTPKTEEIRTQRPRISDDLSIPDAVAKYIDYTPEYQPIKGSLLAYAEGLLREIELQGEPDR
ncbi:exonuclease subunit SbcD [candidate division KSB3 bacterium]|uniref:Nuclease SbcCD subunit D n=1 Tax=candidate division KSB3 bacterium TaxID=2044937 RepID=A0A9D5JX73_9BACT|nr:exonuclease subunit SbcD [candidate division KSB3 bacterium]MBD3325967.1 exonuclease subunit SbcD [candidate division KSB3 bacterium]